MAHQEPRDSSYLHEQFIDAQRPEEQRMEEQHEPDSGDTESDANNEREDQPIMNPNALRSAGK